MTSSIKKHIVLLCLGLQAFCSFSQHKNATAPQLKENIIQYFHQKEYKKAEASAAKYLKLNPHDNKMVYLLGQTNYYLKDWSKAIGYFKTALKNGYNTAEAKYNIACCYALQGNKNKAFLWLNKAIDNHPSFYFQWMEDADLTALAEDPIFHNKLYDYDRGATDRTSQWMADITFFDDRMRQFHYNLFSHISEELWSEKINKLKSEVNNLNDVDIIFRLMQITALVGDGHTVLVPLVSGKYQFGMCPFLTYIFDDGIYVLETRKEYQQLLGAKLIAIDGKPIDEVLQLIQTVIPSDNEFGSKWLQPLALSIPEVLYGLKITEKRNSIKLTYIKNQETNSIQVKVTEKLTADFLETWLYGFHKLKDWVRVKQSKIPASQLKTDEPYWFEYLSEEQMVVFHYNQVKTNPNENEQDFMDRLSEFIDKNPVKALVVDLRYNEGGDNTIYRPLLNGIIANEKINKKGKLFVLVGRRTFSAGMCFATELEKSTQAIFVGEPTGSSPNFVGESGGVFQLPYSGLFVNASNLFWQNSYAFDNRKYIAPDIYIPPKYSDFKNGMDAPLEAVKQYLNKSE